jgi:hypothetical protein
MNLPVKTRFTALVLLLSPLLVYGRAERQCKLGRRESLYYCGTATLGRPNFLGS